jgi:hypothetical protein
MATSAPEIMDTIRNITLYIKHSNQHKQNNTNPQHQKTKWTAFTYGGKEVRKSFEQT